MCSANQICEMVEFLIDRIFVQKFGGRLFRQVIGIPTGTNCASLFADLCLYSQESNFQDNMTTGNLPGHLIYVSDISMIQLCLTIRISENMSNMSIPPNLMLKRLTSLITWQATLI